MWWFKTWGATAQELRPFYTLLAPALDTQREWKIESSAEIEGVESYQSQGNVISATHQDNWSITNWSNTLNNRGYHTKCHSIAQAELAEEALRKKSTLSWFKFASPIRAISTAITKQERIVTKSEPDTETLLGAAQQLDDAGATKTYLISNYSPISFLDSLSYVIENSQSDPIKAQLYIENSLMESEKNKLENEKHLLTTLPFPPPPSLCCSRPTGQD